MQVDDFHSTADKNRYRVTSDNYSVFLYFEQDNKLVPSTGIELTDLFGLTEFSWEADDEITKRKPVTRVEPIAILRNKGFNLDFTFIREDDIASDTYGDIMNLLIAHYRMYMNTYSKLGIESQQNLLVANNEYKRFGENFYSGVTKRYSNTFNQIPLPYNNLFGLNDFKDNDRISRFNEPARHVYVPANIVIEVRIKNYNKVRDEGTYDSYRFSNVTLYSPSQSVAENSSYIVNKFKGFASYLENEFVGKQKDDFANLVDNNIAQTLDMQTGIDRFLRRTIINPNNK